MKWICAQIGAREHYAIPRVVHRAGKLDSLYTDFWASAPWRLIGKLTGKVGLATRFHPELADASVTAFNYQALKASRRHSSNPYEGFLQVGETFGRGVVNALDSNAAMSSLRLHQSAFPLIFFGYDTGFLEPARWIKERGGKTIVCQMDPSRYEVDLVKIEEKRWPGWAKRSVEFCEAYDRRRREEWAWADLVMVNSEWTRQALMKQGLSDDKIVIVPLAYEAGEAKVEKLKSKNRDFTNNHPLRVLFLGQVILRKGIQYLIESARLLLEEPIRFDVVGSIGISDQAVASAPSNMTFHGPVSRDRTEEFYNSADLFVLPTLSDGFALTQLEAMAHELPVIATPNCGEVVTDGLDGLLVPASDPNALAEAFQLILQDSAKLVAMTNATQAKVEMFNLAKLDQNLTELETRLL